MVEAVPITMQWPLLRAIQPSTSLSCSSVSRPARYSSNRRRPSVPEPISFCPQCPLSCGPPVTMTAGTSALAAPMSCAGVVLSQPLSNTTASIGLARMHSSTSIDIKLRKSMVVGFMNSSPNEIVGNSSGTPPAAHTPRLTASATCRRWMLQCVSSLQELQMPMTGLPEKPAGARPSERKAARRAKPSYSDPSNHSALLSFFESDMGNTIAEALVDDCRSTR